MVRWVYFRGSTWDYHMDIFLMIECRFFGEKAGEIMEIMRSTRPGKVSQKSPLLKTVNQRTFDWGIFNSYVTNYPEGTSRICFCAPCNSILSCIWGDLKWNHCTSSHLLEFEGYPRLAICIHGILMHYEQSCEFGTVPDFSMGHFKTIWDNNR